jgi:hypothetical protein
MYSCVAFSRGVDVMITYTLRFAPIFGEKIGVFLKIQCNDKFLQKLAVVSSKKPPILLLKFSAKIFLKS